MAFLGGLYMESGQEGLDWVTPTDTNENITFDTLLAGDNDIMSPLRSFK